MNKRLLFIDTETGGLDPQKHSLLTIGVVVWDKNQGELFSDEYAVNSDEFIITKSALRINHFDEEKHRESAISPKEIVCKFHEIKKAYFQDFNTIPLAGHNTTFDIQFLKQLFISCGRSFEKLFSHRVVDTYTVIKYLVDCDCIPDSINSSAKAFEYFEIVVDGRHTAIGDARATMQLYSKTIQFLSNHIKQ